jgi:hypothetical protein
MKIKTTVKTDGFIANHNQTTTRDLMVKRLATRILQWSVAVIIISGLCSLGANARTTQLPAQNKAIYLGWGAFVDTQANFSTFFDSDHTLAAWFMPQFLYGYQGPIFANEGTATGTYIFGMEDYKKGNVQFVNPGFPVMSLQVGNQKRLYLVPQLTKEEWHHLAVIRKANQFNVFLDGGKLPPIAIINNEILEVDPLEVDDDFIYDSSNHPTGNLRFGRKNGWMGKGPQAYGLLDDVAVFNRALTQTALISIMNNKRLSGQEAGLRFGWCFDEPANSSLPPLLDSSASFSRAKHATVSSTRSNLDKATFYKYDFLAHVQAPVQLPFAAGEVWKVNQGYDDPDGSHNDFAVHSYDFSRVSGSSQYAPIYSGSVGKVVQYVKDGGLDSNGQEANVIRIRPGSEPNELLSYRHLAPNSISGILDVGVCDANSNCNVDPGLMPVVAQGQFLAKVGPKAAHLHFGGINRTDGAATTERVTIPVAFDDYFVSDDQGHLWLYISRGYPRAGQWVQRAH